MRRSWEGAACTDLQQGCARDWLLPNGVGGYASQSLPGVSTRAQHSLLMATTERGELYSLLAQLEDLIEDPSSSNKYPLSTHQYHNAFWPHAYKSLQKISLDPVPTWVYSFGSHIVAKRIEVAQKRHATRVSYYLLQGDPVTLRIRPLFSFRPQQQLRQKKDGVEYSFAHLRDTLTVLPDGEPLPCVLQLGEARFQANPDWFFRFVYQQNQELGLSFEEDLFTPGEISIELSQEKPFSFWAAADLSPPPQKELLPAPSLLEKKQEIPLFSGPLLIARQIAKRKSLLALQEQLAQSATSFWLEDSSKTMNLITSLDAPSELLWPKMLALPGICRATGRTQEGSLLAQRLLEQAQQDEDILLGIWAASELFVEDEALLSLCRKKIAPLLQAPSFQSKTAQSASLAGLFYRALSWLLSYEGHHDGQEPYQSAIDILLQQKANVPLIDASSLWAFATAHPLFSGQEARPMLDRARSEWLTTKGLREGESIFPWRLGIYCHAYLNVYGDNNASAKEHVEQCLLGLSAHLENEGAIGFVSEKFSLDEHPRGALTFAPSIAELLRVLERLGIK